MTNGMSVVTQARAARIAGAMYLVTMATAVFSESYVRGSLFVRGDATQTAQNILGSERLFRISIAMDILTYTGVTVLIWALYVLLRPVDRNLSLVAAFLRLVEVAIASAGTLGSLVALRFLSGADYLKTFEASELHSLARVALGAQGFGLTTAFVPLGFGSAVFAYLLLKSRYVPRVVAGWGVFASLLLATSSLATLVFPVAAQRFQWPAMIPMGIYEVILGFWLLLKGARIEAGSASAARAPQGVGEIA